MPRMIRIGGKYINADRLYSIEPLPGDGVVRIAYEIAPNHLANFDCRLTGSGDEDAGVRKWARDLVMAIDPTYISFNGEVESGAEDAGNHVR